MKTAAVIRHVQFEDLGSLEKTLDQLGISIQYIDASMDNMETIRSINHDLLIILGGPISANDTDDYPWLLTEMEQIRQRLAHQKPVIGICLGAQLIAKACGKQVLRGHVKEIGWDTINITHSAHPIALLKDIPVLHWHGETFELPDDAVHLASSQHYSNQAFTIGRHCIGMQFHPEAMREKIDWWLTGHSLEISMQPSLSVSSLRAETYQHADRLEQQAPAFWRELLRYMDNHA